ncbi:alpha/beta hydrolase [Mucilaginibacter limnophilus]|uniref:Alpha/beta hydrolase n=1 Tax=Mucilaginibacter limnophilus TaxID=1932778 RepID=A0A3S2V5P8_9SPHI|nr:alpha/beta hydrolase [Mucilaginibacter limnophilus]RVT96523.1 alpha/beta hydrolase [Mucilaginibacter limnophilus]
MKNTIVFIHGMFQNPKSWEKWINYFSEKGYNCVAPAWPMHEGEPAELRQSPPDGLGDLRLEEIIYEMQQIVKDQGQPPIVIGHSVGGLITQLLVSNGLVQTGVAISSVAPNMMLSFDWGFMKNSALITNPFKGNDPFYMDEESFHGSFANTLSEEEAKVAYQQYATHDSRNVLRDCLGSDGHIDLDMPHVPLLFVGGEKDQIIPASLNEKNVNAYKDEVSITAFKEFANRSHFICGEPGWEEVAGYIYEWLQRHEQHQYDTAAHV